MANTSSRTLRLLSLLQTHRYWPGAELANRLEVSARTLRRDVERLRELGYPVEAHRGVDGGYQLAAGAALPPLVLDDDEAVAIAVGLQTAANGAVEGIAESSVRALTKVVQVMPQRLRRRVDALRSMTVPGTWNTGGPTIEPALLTTLAQVCRDTERLEFSYTTAAGAVTERHVEPHRLVCLGRHWYLVGYDLLRHDWRTFRLDRLTGPHGTGHRFLPRTLPATDAAAFVRSGIDRQRVPHTVEAVVHAPANTVRELIGRWGTVEDAGAHRCVLRMSTDSLDWPTMALGSIGADFEIREPPELQEYVRDWADRFHRASSAASPRQVGPQSPEPTRSRRK